MEHITLIWDIAALNLLVTGLIAAVNMAQEVTK